MPRIRVHRGHHPVRSDLTGDPPPPIGAIRALRRLDILTGHQRQQRQRRPHRFLQLVLIARGERRNHRTPNRAYAFQNDLNVLERILDGLKRLPV
jgi:hypothetical protein